MMQGDMNAPATFVRVMEHLFHDELGKFIWIYIDDILSSAIALKSTSSMFNMHAGS